MIPEVQDGFSRLFAHSTAEWFKYIWPVKGHQTLKGKDKMLIMNEISASDKIVRQWYSVR